MVYSKDITQIFYEFLKMYAIMYAVEKIFVDILKVTGKISVRYNASGYAIQVPFECFVSVLRIVLKIIKKVIGTNNKSVRTTDTKINQ